MSFRDVLRSLAALRFKTARELAAERLRLATGCDAELAMIRATFLEGAAKEQGMSNGEFSQLALILSQAIMLGWLDIDGWRSIRESGPDRFLDALREVAGAELRYLVDRRELSGAMIEQALDRLRIFAAS